MGIYISGVKGLPEQVQANKEDIKTIKEEIEGIDFEQIRQLEAQVGENTQDINNLEASIGVQNQAINGLKDRADALESKTQLMTYNSDLSMTDFRNSIEVADDVYARNVRVEGDGSIVNTSQSGMHFKEGANDDTLTIANNDGATPHYLHFNADGTLDIDGNAVGGKPLYEHNLKLTILANPIVLQLITDSATAFTITSLRDFLRNLGYTSSSNRYNMYYMVFDGTTHYIVEGLYGTTANLCAFYAEVGATTSNQNITFVNDQVRQIA